MHATLLPTVTFKYVLPGKFTNDAIEGRFGWHREVNGGNFYMLILHLFQGEKKIRCLSVLRQKEPVIYYCRKMMTAAWKSLQKHWCLAEIGLAEILVYEN